MPRTGRKRDFHLPMDEVRELTNRGWGLKRLAERYGCSRQTVCNRMREAGIPTHPQHSCPGEKNPFWRGGRWIDPDGYVMIWKPGHPHASKASYVREHRLVMEEKLGRYLDPKEVVHHLNGVKDDNRPENLELFSCNADHLRKELKGRVPNWTEDGKRRIRDGVRKPRGPLSEQARANMSAAQRNRQPRPPMSDATKEKIRQAALLRGFRKRASIQLPSGIDAPSSPEPTDHPEA